MFRKNFPKLILMIQNNPEIPKMVKFIHYGQLGAALSIFLQIWKNLGQLGPFGAIWGIFFKSALELI